MNDSGNNCLKLRTRTPANPTRQNDAFTLTDLLFVILALAMLAIVVFPAFADVQNKGGRLQCANNLRQIGQDSMIYAGENNGWLPVCTLGAANDEGGRSNYLGAEHYTRYVFYAATPNSRITTNEPPLPYGGGYQNLGYLFQAGLAGNGSIFYCPASSDPVMMEQYYEPLLTADSTGIVLSGYMYNPRMLNPAIRSGYPVRKYQTTSQLEPHKLFAVDAILAGGSSAVDGGVGSGIDQTAIQHTRDHGWNVLFTDGSVQFARLSQNNNSVYYLVTQNLELNESENSWEGYDETFDFLEEDH